MDCSVGEVRAVFTNVLTALWTYLWKLPRKYLLQTNFAPSSTYCFLFYMIKELNEFKVCVLIPGFCRYFYVCGYPLILFFRKYVVRNRFYQKTIFWWKLWIPIREEKAYWVRPWAWQNALSISSYLSLELLLVSHGFHSWKEIIIHKVIQFFQPLILTLSSIPCEETPCLVVVGDSLFTGNGNKIRKDYKMDLPIHYYEFCAWTSTKISQLQGWS